VELIGTIFTLVHIYSHWYHIHIGTYLFTLVHIYSHWYHI
jgi:hypothetical protein